MNNYALEQAEELFEQALEYFLGIEKEKNMIHAKELLQQSSELGLSKSSNLLGDWYIKKIIQGIIIKKHLNYIQEGMNSETCVHLVGWQCAMKRGME